MMTFRAARILRMGLLAAAFLCGSLSLDAHNVTIQYEKVKVGGSLSVTVVDQNGDPIPGLVVAEMGKNWKNSLRKTKTDAKGIFAFTPVSGRQIYYFQISAVLFKWVQFRMRVDSKRGTALKIEMEVAD
jgi:carboxypeptidase family protein